MNTVSHSTETICVTSRTLFCNNCLVVWRRYFWSCYSGFLPTYGPSFIHLYGKNIGEKCCSCRCRCDGKCSTMRPIYRGRVLLSLKTEIDDPERSCSASVETEPTAPIIEVNIINGLPLYKHSVTSFGIYETSVLNQSKKFLDFFFHQRRFLCTALWVWKNRLFIV